MARNSHLWRELAGWLVRGGSISLVLLVMAMPRPTERFSPPTAKKVRLDNPQTVQTSDPRVCVHTRLTDEVEEAKIQQTLRSVRAMGAPLVVEFFPWAYVEAQQGKYDWTHPDRIIKHAENQGITVIARLGIVPDWARDGNPALNFLPEDHFGDFADFVEAFAARYRGRVKHILIWNEPNLNFEWGGRAADPQAYTRLLKLSYTAAHQGNPDVLVLSAGLAPTIAPPGGMSGGWDDIDYLREMYKAGAKDYFDAMGAHTYGFGLPPLLDPAPDALNFRRIELIHAVMEEFGDGDKDVYLTETGWNDHPRWAYGVRPIERINYTLEIFNYTRDNYPWLKSVCLWVFRYPIPTNSYPDYYTLVAPNFDPKPIYSAIQQYTQESSQ